MNKNCSRIFSLIGISGAILAGIVFSQTTHAETFIRQYEYIPNNFDDLESSREVASDELRKELLNEVGVNVYHEINVNVDSDRVLAAEEYEVITSGFVSLKIIDEKWDGSIYKLKAELKVDPEEIKRNIRVIKENKNLMKKIKRLASDKKRLNREIQLANEEREKSIRKSKQYDIYYGTLDAYKRSAKNLRINNLMIEGFIESNVRNNLVKACEAWVKAKELGSNFPSILGMVGLCYESGSYVEKNIPKALELFREGMKQYPPDLVSHMTVAARRLEDKKILLPDGETLTKEYAEKIGEKLIELGADGRVISRFVFSVLEGNNSSEMILKWAKLAYAADLLPCVYGLEIGEAYDTGTYDGRVKFPISEKKMLEWYERTIDSCKTKKRWAAGLAAFRLYTHFQHKKKEYDKAIDNLKLSAKYGDWEALFLLSGALQMGFHVNRDKIAAFRMFKKGKDELGRKIVEIENRADPRDVEYKKFLISSSRLWDGYSYFRGIGGVEDKEKAKRIWGGIIDFIESCSRPICLWAYVAYNELNSDSQVEEFESEYRHYAKHGEMNSIYDLNRRFLINKNAIE